MDKNIYSLINEQINKELYSAYAYYLIAEYYRAKGLHGFHVWFEKQASEEVEHAEKFSEYLQDNGEKVVLKSIEVLKREFKDLRDPLVFQVEHEAFVTSLIHNIAKEAGKIDDLATLNFLDWFIEEQREEEKNARDLLIKFDLFAKEGGLGLYELDKEMGARK